MSRENMDGYRGTAQEGWTNKTSSHNPRRLRSAIADDATSPNDEDRGQIPARLPCVFESILSRHIQQKVAEERLRYDAALLRANDILTRARKLKDQVRALAGDFGTLENQLQGVTSLNTHFRRVAKERLDYLDNQSYLAGLIASLLAQHRDKDLVWSSLYSPYDWQRIAFPTESKKRMSRQKRRFLYKLLCAKGTDGY